MIDIEMVAKKDTERFYKADLLIWTIKQQADLFEMRTGFEPTIMMTLDLVDLIATSFRDVLVHRVDKNQTGTTVCGYDLEILPAGRELLYVGYKIDMS